MKRSACLIGMLALVLLSLATRAAAQETRGSIEGIVKDTSGAVLPGVTVEARSPALVGAATAVSDAAGLYRFPALRPGQYEVTAVLSGFQTHKIANIQLQLGQILKIDVPMQVGGLSESVQVTAESPIIDVKQNAATLSIGSELIERIPRGRNFTSVLTSAPGTNQEAKAGLSIDGATGAENRYVIDGMDTTNLRTGVSAKPVLLDFVEEVQVKSSGYNAEYRATTGGVVSAVTRSGGNTLPWWCRHLLFGRRLGGQRAAGASASIPRIRPSPSTSPRPATRRTTWTRSSISADPSCATRCGSTSAMARSSPVPIARSRSRRTTRRRRSTTTAKSRVSTTHVTSQLNSAMRVKFAGSNQRSYGGSTLPAKEANGTSTANPTLFPNPLHTNGLTDSVRRRTGLGGDAEVLRQHQRRLLRLRHVPGDRHAVLLRSSARVRCFEHVHRRGGLNGLSLPRHSLVASAIERLRRQAGQHPERSGHFRPGRRQRRCHLLRQLQGPAHLQGRRAVGTAQQ